MTMRVTVTEKMTIRVRGRDHNALYVSKMGDSDRGQALSAVREVHVLQLLVESQPFTITRPVPAAGRGGKVVVKSVSATH